jgi:Asp-tRNA(Asn)/Glu-tRNA(Gln) amidotransferase A subunit family amidase
VTMDLDTVDGSAIRGAILAEQTFRAEVADHFIQRIERHEPNIRAFAAFEPEKVQIKAESQTVISGGLSGIPIGVKDIFDTADYPTEFFSPIYSGRRPQADAAVVAALRRAGAIIIGKTHTAEFAYMHTGPTRNPHDLQRTPGSSSAGSAAGLAAGFFPLALGTQTAGSLIKPASYCGAFAFKPSYGRVSLQGVKLLAPSFDTVGWFGRSVADLDMLARILMPEMERAALQTSSPKLGNCRTSKWETADDEIKMAIEGAVETLRASGVSVANFDLPALFNDVFDDHAMIDDAEGTASLRWEAEAAPEKLSPEIHAMFERASVQNLGAVEAARNRLHQAAPILKAILAPFDAVIAPSCGVVAPVGLQSTGPSDFIKLWTAFGLPQVNLPIARAEGDLPVGLQLIGRRGGDAILLDAARVAADIISHQTWRLASLQDLSLR